MDKSESVTTGDYDLAQFWIQAHEEATKAVLDQEGDRTVSFEDINAPPPLASIFHASSSEGAQVMETAKNSERNESVEQERFSNPKNMEILLQTTLPELNELSRRRSP